MNNSTDFSIFCKHWKLAYQMLGQKEPNADVLKAIFNMFQEFSLNVVIEAIQYHVANSEFLIKPVHVFDYIDRKNGITAESLKNDAYVFFDTELNRMKGSDIVIQNWRFAHAFKTCFRSVSDFLRRPNNDYSLNRDREIFANAVANLQRSYVDKTQVQRVLIGTRTFMNSIHVSFYGDYDICKQIAIDYYASTGEDMQFRIEYPAKPAALLEMKAPAKEDKEMTEEQKQQSMEYMKELINVLTVN